MLARQLMPVANHRKLSETIVFRGGANYSEDSEEGLFLEYRSGRLDDATESDRQHLAESCKIKTVVDLSLRYVFLFVPLSLSYLLSPSSEHSHPRHSEETKPLLPAPTHGTWETLQINFVSRNLNRRLILQLRWWQLLLFLVLKLLGPHTAAERLVIRNVLQKLGRAGLARYWLQYLQPGILQTLEVLSTVEA
jgi:hypothetical protein